MNDSSSTRSDEFLHADVECKDCRYNLRGLQREGKCPECGLPVWMSLFHRSMESPWSAALRDEPFRRNLRSAFALMLISDFWMMVYSLLPESLLLVSLPLPVTANKLSVLIAATWWSFSLMAVWKFCSRVNGIPSDDISPAISILIRLAYTVYVLLLFSVARVLRYKGPASEIYTIFMTVMGPAILFAVTAFYSRLITVTLALMRIRIGFATPVLAIALVLGWFLQLTISADLSDSLYRFREICFPSFSNGLPIVIAAFHNGFSMYLVPVHLFNLTTLVLIGVHLICWLRLKPADASQNT